MKLAKFEVVTGEILLINPAHIVGIIAKPYPEEGHTKLFTTNDQYPWLVVATLEQAEEIINKAMEE